MEKMSKMKMTISIDETTKQKAEELARLTGYSQSQIIELLLNGASESEIVALYKKSLKGKQMTITKDDREEIKAIEKKFNNGSMITHSEKCILADWYELILIQKNGL